MIADIASAILLIRGQRVILDSDLARLYGVPTKRMNEQVKRNVDRFPADFMFRLSGAETTELNRRKLRPVPGEPLLPPHSSAGICARY